MSSVAIISGGSGAIGSAIAERLAHEGFIVAIGYNKNKDKAVSLSDKLNSEGFSAFSVSLDITSSTSVRSAVALCAEYGKIELLVNCSGTSIIKPIQDYSEYEVKSLIDNNLTGHILLTKAVVPHMVLDKKGHIINISSMWGVLGASCETVYSAAKAGLICFSKALAKELGPSGIRVNCIAPGVIDTPMNSELTDDDMASLVYATPLGRIGTPEDIADAVWAIHTCSFVTGQCLTADGGYTL